jgi:hypothetical protein
LGTQIKILELAQKFWNGPISELDFFDGSVETPRRANYSGSSLPRGGRRTILLQQRDPAAVGGGAGVGGPRRFRHRIYESPFRPISFWTNSYPAIMTSQNCTE